jgi:outer membrane protein assembly factor BamB
VADGLLVSGAAVWPAGGCGAPTCEPLWTNGVAFGNSAAALAEGTIYITSPDGFLEAYAAEGCGAPTCAPRWRAPGPAFRVPTVAGGVVYVAGEDSRLYAYDAGGCSAALCEPLAVIDLPAAPVFNGEVAVAGGRVFLALADSTLVALAVP